MNKFVIKFVFSIILFTLLISLRPAHSLAFDTTYSNYINSSYYNNLIGNDAYIFKEETTMSVQDIQNFFVQRNSFLKDYSPDGRSAAQIIWDTAHGLGNTGGTFKGITLNQSTGTVNPRVILLTLEKENSLWDYSSQPDQDTLDCAMGYEWGNGCHWMFVNKPALRGFVNQVENASFMLRYNYEIAQKNNEWWDTNYPSDFHYQVNSTKSSVLSYKDGKYYNVTFQNAATAALYRYTPYVSNGNYNFWQLYKRFFISEMVLNVSPGGSVSATAAGQTRICNGESCKLQFPEGSIISLSANGSLNVPAEFTGWSGGCLGLTATCTTTMNDGLSILASFKMSLDDRLQYIVPANWWDTSHILYWSTGNFTGDDKIDYAAAYLDVSEKSTKFWIFENTGTSFTPRLLYTVPANWWDTSRILNWSTGDFNGDSMTDYAVAYQTRFGDTKFWVFNNNGNTLTPKLWHTIYANWWDTSRILNWSTGDFNGDSMTDYAVAYQTRFGDTKFWVFKSNGVDSFLLDLWSTIPNYWWDTSRILNWSTGNFVDDNIDGNNNKDYEDFAVTYKDRSDNSTKFWIFKNTGSTFASELFYEVPSSWWDTNRILDWKTGDFDGDKDTDYAIIYKDRSDNTTNFWIFKNLGTHTLSPELWNIIPSYWWDTSRVVNWNIGNFITDDSVIDYDDLIATYKDRSDNSTKFWIFNKSNYAYTKDFH